MYNIVISGDGDGLLTKTIVCACMNYGGVLVGDGKNIYETTHPPEFLILRAESESVTDCGGILVLGNDICDVCPVIKNKEIITIADTGCAGQLSFLAGHGGTVIGCSMSERDTVSLSCSNDSRIVSIRRCITALDGTVIEPCEIAVNGAENIPVYPLLASCCVLALCGVPFEEGYRLY